MPIADHYWMAEALRLAARGQYSTHPNPAVGCVIVKNGELVSQGWHQQAGQAHAEINAIQAAEIPQGCDFYISLEPCSHHGRTGPCVEAVLATKPAAVIVAMQDPNPQVAGRGLHRLQQAGVDTRSGVMKTEAETLNAGFIKRMRKQMPLVSLKMACSLDGKTALANGLSQWISGESARRDVQFQRARASAILSTSATVTSDNARLNVRLNPEDLGQSIPVRQPVRVIIDRAMHLTGTESLFSLSGDILIYTANANSSRVAAVESAGGQVINLPVGDKPRQLNWILQDLAQREINSIHCECGPTISGALLEAGLVDQLVLYQSPCLLGDAGKPLIITTEIESMDNRYNLSLKDFRRFGEDSRMTFSLE